MVKGQRNCVVHVISSHWLAARFLCENLKSEPEIEVDASKNLRPGDSSEPCVFLIDTIGLKQPPEKVVRALTAGHPAARFILMTNDDEDFERNVFFLLSTGIHGLIRAAEVESSLATMVFAVANGNVCFPNKLLHLQGQLKSALSAADTVRIHWTPRERTILALLERRSSNREIADMLGIAESTVKSYVSTILSKLGLTSRRELSGSSLA